MRVVDFIKRLELQRDDLKKHQKTIPEKTLCYELLELKMASINFCIELFKAFGKEKE